MGVSMSSLFCQRQVILCVSFAYCFGGSFCCTLHLGCCRGDGMVNHLHPCGGFGVEIVRDILGLWLPSAKHHLQDGIGARFPHCFELPEEHLLFFYKSPGWIIHMVLAFPSVGHRRDLLQGIVSTPSQVVSRLMWIKVPRGIVQLLVEGSCRSWVSYLGRHGMSGRTSTPLHWLCLSELSIFFKSTLT